MDMQWRGHLYYEIHILETSPNENISVTRYAPWEHPRLGRFPLRDMHPGNILDREYLRYQIYTQGTFLTRNILVVEQTPPTQRSNSDRCMLVARLLITALGTITFLEMTQPSKSNDCHKHTTPAFPHWQWTTFRLRDRSCMTWQLVWKIVIASIKG